MILDDLDCFVIKEILSNKQTSTWEMAKKFKWKDREESHNYNDECSFIVRRLEKMVKSGIITKTKEEGKNVYLIKKDKVFYTKSFNFQDCKSEAISIKENDKWIILQI